MKKYSLLIALFLVGCGGGGGSNPAPPITVSPTVQPTAIVPACTDPHKSDYPQAYNGWRPIPKPTQQLPNSYQRGISFKDYYPGWVYDNAKGSIKNCTKDEYVKLMYTQSLDLMKANGVTMTWLYNFGAWNSTGTTWVVDKANYHIPEPIVEFIVAEAKKRNIDVYYAWQFTTYDTANNTLVNLGEQVSTEKLNKILDAHQKQVIEMARFAQRIGIKGIAADWNAMNLGNLRDPTINEVYINRFSTIIDDIRKNYSGQITWGQIGHIENDPRILDKIDAVHLSLGGSILSEVENINLSPEIVKIAIEKQIYGMNQAYNCISPHNCKHVNNRKVPVFFEISVQSRDKYFTHGWVEDGFCVEGTTPAGTKTACIQDTYVTDFAVQAIGIEGILKAIISQQDFTVKGVNFHTAYWHSNTLAPGYEGFPNLSQSIRGKPAEKIVKYWFTGT